MPLKNAVLRFSMALGGANSNGAAIEPLLLHGQVDGAAITQLQRQILEYTGSGVSVEEIRTLFRPTTFTYNVSGWDDAILDLVENVGASVSWKDWHRAEAGILPTTGRRIGLDGRLITSDGNPGLTFSEFLIVGPFEEPAIPNRQQATQINQNVLTQRVRRLEMFNTRGGMWRYVNYDTGENLIAEAGTRASKTTRTKTDLVQLA